FVLFFSSRRRHTRLVSDWSSDVCSSDLVAVIPGDGIGKEVLPEGMRVLDAAGKKFGITFDWTQFDWSCEVFAKTGRMMPPDGLRSEERRVGKEWRSRWSR